MSSSSAKVVPIRQEDDPGFAQWVQEIEGREDRRRMVWASLWSDQKRNLLDMVGADVALAAYEWWKLPQKVRTDIQNTLWSYDHTIKKLRGLL